MTRKIGLIAAVVLASTLTLAGCAPELIFDASTTEPTTQPNTQESTAPVPGDATAMPEEPAAGPPTQEESCGWDSSPMKSGSSKAPSGQTGDLANALIGAWQHTHMNEGAGYEAVGATTDIRYVFPSTTRMVYCQDVAGATSQAENATDMTLNGMEIVLQPSGVSYGVVAWDANSMVLKNHRDGVLYLLQRR